ncbi:MAG TPA: hypothetical protein VNI52_03090 [Sphingobacteriaceae bacterium]|nr:hypothetical protein [Sphingobacteriaceae bacterium]
MDINTEEIMTQDQFENKLLTEYANIAADVLLGINLKKHLENVNGRISEFNTFIDHHQQEGIECPSLQAMGYNYYVMRDHILKAINPIADIIKE